MPGRLASQPFFVLLTGIGAVAMLVPAVLALNGDDFLTAQAFFYGALLFSIIAWLIAVAMNRRDGFADARGQLLALLAAFALLPLMFALPLWLTLPGVGLVDAWFEMVSSFTTTGATIFDDPAAAPPAVHLWRALVGWLGGLLMWIAALAVFAPMAIGGFEVRGTAERVPVGQADASSAPAARLARYAGALIPIYAGLTAVLWFCLTLLGDSPLIALCHAMSVMATSGISPAAGLGETASGIGGEVVIALFFVFALSRMTFGRGLGGEEPIRLRDDPELQMAVVFVLGVTALLFLRHWLGAPAEDTDNFGEGLAALWGGFFTVLSFLTTTGFESRAWPGAAQWSGLETPGLILVGLAIIGGGVATTAGGVKLLRVYALYKHGQREVERLVHPSSVGGAGRAARRIRREGATIAWIFFMLFALSIAAVMVLVSLTGVSFETTMVLTVAAISNTGPLATAAAESPISYAVLPDAAKIILALTMVLGRLETLAIIALLNPDFWRR